MQKELSITTLSATAAAKLKTWVGTTCPGLPRALSVSGFFANANSFFGGSARSARRGTLPVECHRRANSGRVARVNKSRPGDCVNRQFVTVLLTKPFLTNRKEGAKPWQPKRNARSLMAAAPAERIVTGGRTT